MHTRKFIPVVATALLVAAGGMPVHADDTDVFVSRIDSASSQTIPNILLIVDTSGSMGTNVVTQVEFNPSTTYSGCYDGDALYFTQTLGNVPPCDDGAGNKNENFIEKTANKCASSRDPLQSAGVYNGQLAAWNEEVLFPRWDPLNGSKKQRPVECKDDSGLHGENATSSKRWATNTLGPWSENSKLEIEWDQDAFSYLIYDGNWLNWNAAGGTVNKSRIQIVREVTTQLLDNLGNVNVGLMRFNFEQGGPVVHAVRNLNTPLLPSELDVDGDGDNDLPLGSLVRDRLILSVAALPASGWTPLSETYYEAAQYLMGRKVFYGDPDAGDSNRAAHGALVSVPNSRTGGALSSDTYNSPARFQCQKNYVVMLTDGAPTRDVDADERIKALPDFADFAGADCDGTGDGRCLDDLAEYLFEHDMRDDQRDLQNVTTYTVGFTVDLPILASTAERGGGQYYLADDTSSLAIVLQEIVDNIIEDASTFAAPVAPINAFNRAETTSDVFLSMFEPRASIHWPGNLKRYKLENGRLVDAKGNPATEPGGNLMSPDAHSFWTVNGPDGNQVAMGGAASRLPDWKIRNVYTDINGNTLTAAGNSVETGNATISADTVGAPILFRNDVIEWARGRDVLDIDDDGLNDDNHNQMGDPLHVQPVIINYSDDAAVKQSVLFVSTNDGYFHAFNADTGRELWSYVPQRLLGRMYKLFANDKAANKGYGLDGQIQAYIINDDRLPGISGDERVILVFGMRRGGDAVFALDVTDPQKPKKLWEIDPSTTGFGALGQTWSVPQLAEVNIGGTRKPVAIFGGGYDPTNDNGGYRAADDYGNAIYVVDLLDGDLEWSAGPVGGHDLVLPDLTHSIPAALNVIDSDGDRLADRIYTGDMGGRVWRFDLVNGESRDKFGNGGIVAALGATPDGDDEAKSEHARRFYATPDVVTLVDDERVFMSINIGSGFRAGPMEADAEDYFFAIRDFRPFGVLPTADYAAPVTRKDLVDVTGDDKGNLTATLLPTDPGWSLRMVNGDAEKILERSLTFRGTTFFTSFSPDDEEDPCRPVVGKNRIYRVNVLDGRPAPLDYPEDPNDLTAQDRITDSDLGGILAPVTLLTDPDYSPDNDGDGKPDKEKRECAVYVGSECLFVDLPPEAIRTYWLHDEVQ